MGTPVAKSGRKQILESILRLAKSLQILEPKMREEIETLAPTMDAVALEELHRSLMELQKAHLEQMKRELEVRQEVAAHVTEQRADKARNVRQSKENSSRQKDFEEAEGLLNNL